LRLAAQNHSRPIDGRVHDDEGGLHPRPKERGLPVPPHHSRTGDKHNIMTRKVATIELYEEDNGYISSRVKYDDPKISEHKKMAIWIMFETIDRNFNTVYRLPHEEIHKLRNAREEGNGSVIPTLVEMLLLKGDEVPMLVPRGK